MEPCEGPRFDLQLLIVTFSFLTSCLTLWLAHRRREADRDRKKFYWQMRRKHELPVSEAEKKRSERGDFL